VETTSHEKGWLAALVAAELARHDPQDALARLPPEVRAAGASADDLAPAARLLVARSLRRRRLEDDAGPAAGFLDDVRLHVGLLLDLGALRGEPFDADYRRAEIAAFLAAAVGDVDAALEALPPVRRWASERDVAWALRAAEGALAARFDPPGDPVRGLPLYPGHIAILRRRLARVAMGFHRGRQLDPVALASHAAYAHAETVLLVEMLAGVLDAAGSGDAGAPAVRQRQVARLVLPRAAARDARAAVLRPRPPEEIAAAAPERVRPFLVEQLFLGLLRARLAGDGTSRFIEAFLGACGLDPAVVAAAQVEAAAQHGDHHVWFEAFAGTGIDWQALAGDWGAATDAAVERVSAAVTDNLGAVLTEIRQTGELGQLLARAAAGATLTHDERRKVRAQLIDLAKAVPALAIFAAPGGMLLLPLLAKLLPFNLLPSAWDRPGDGKAPPPGGKPPTPPDPAK